MVNAISSRCATLPKDHSENNTKSTINDGPGLHLGPFFFVFTNTAQTQHKHFMQRLHKSHKSHKRQVNPSGHLPRIANGTTIQNHHDKAVARAEQQARCADAKRRQPSAAG